MNIGNRCNLLIAGIIIFFLFQAMSSCGSQSDQQASQDGDTLLVTDTSQANADEQLEATINEAMTRLRYKDKTYLYDLEFTYYKDEHTFDDYLDEGRIINAQADTLEFVDVINVTYFGNDSAVADVEVHFKGPGGQETTRKGDHLTFYWHNGRWIKPTLSNFDGQRLYDKIRYQADSAAKAEAREFGND